MEVAVAGAAVGATIKVVLQNLLSYPVEEIGLLWNFKEDFQELKESVTTILEFLEDAEMKHVTDKPVNRWLQKLDALAFDADYVFDELNYQLLRKKVESNFKEKKLQVSSSLSTCIPFSFRHKMARKIKDIKKKLRSINKEARDLGLQMRVAGTQSRGDGLEGLTYLETDSFAMDPVFVGRDNDVTKMVEMLITSSSTEHVISVLPIVGMGGLGKTTLTRKVFNHAGVVSNFGKRMWVHVPETFDPVSVLRRVVASSTGENVEGSREVVLKKLLKSLEDKRYLLVLDNVWNVNNEKWDNLITSLEGINSVKGNVIMVTTRSRDVASTVKTLDIHELNIISEEDSWLIIKAKAFRGEDTSQFETIGANIARRCGGLPLAAKVVGSLLRGKSKDEWVSVEDKWLSEFPEDKMSISNILKLSFDNLPLPSLKKCFAFYSIIPRRWWTEKDELIQIWMAEGFLHDEEINMEIVGDKVLNFLAQSSLIEVLQKDYYGDVNRCAMHDLMHDLAFSILNPKSLHETYQARYISTSHIEDLSSMPKDQAKCVRALFFNGEASKIMFSNLKHLHVLILIDDDLDKLPMEIGNLISLRYLDICHTRIESLPDSICHLYHLQTLRATMENGRKAYLKKLPDTFKYMISLRHLYTPNIKLPPQIGKLTSLQTLPYFQVGDEEGCRIMELGSLKNLKGEIEIHNLEKVGDKEEAMSAELFHKPNILKLKLVWNEVREGETNDVDVLEGLQPHRNLKILEINGYKGTHFPLWTSRMAVRGDLLDNLIEIRLSDCKECEEIPMLGHLPHLKSLYLKNLSNVKFMGSSFYGIEGNGVDNEAITVFPVLEKLELISMEKLIAWTEVEHPSSSCKLSVFGRLEYLKISDCRKLIRVPSQFQCLKELEVDNMESGLPLANICGGSKLHSLKKLKIYRVDGLVRLPDALFSNNRDLLEFEISECKDLMHLVRYMCLGGGGASLREMKIYHCPNFVGLPDDLHKLNALEELRIFNCPNLTAIPIPSPSGGPQPQGFTSLSLLEIASCGVITLPIQMIESCASSLEALFIGMSCNLTNLPQVMSILRKMPRLRRLAIDRVPKFRNVAAEIGRLRRLEYLSIGGSPDCWNYVSFTASLGCIFPTLQYLGHLAIVGIELWDAIPDQLQYLTTLHLLHLVAFGIGALPEWLGNLASLTELRLVNCQKLRCLPSKKVMQGLTTLTRLIIKECPLLKQNLDGKESDADSEWSKISHIPTIDVDGTLISAPAH